MSQPPVRSFTLLVNPHAGGSATAAAVAVAGGLRARGARVEVIHSSGPAAARDLAVRAVAQGDVVAAVGGDGMVASLVGTLVDHAGNGGVLGLVPAGRGNDFARMVGVRGEVEDLVDRLLSAEPRAVDVITLSGAGRDQVVAGSVYAGADAHAAAMVARMRRVPKPLQYPLAALRAIATYRPNRYRVVVDGAVHEVVAATVVVANSAYYGAGMKVAPNALIDDGLLEVVIVGAGSRVELATAFPKIYDGSHVGHPKVTVLRGAVVELSAYAGREVPVGGDGEDLGTLPEVGGEPLRIGVRPRALKVL